MPFRSEVAATLLSRMERGLRHISPEAVMGLSVVYDLPAAHRTELDYEKAGSVAVLEHLGVVDVPLRRGDRALRRRP